MGKSAAALLRGVNVSGKNSVSMKALREVLSSGACGLDRVETYIQSGNVTFEIKEERDEKDVARKIEEVLLEDMGVQVPVIVRSKQYFQDIIDHVPYEVSKGLYGLFLNECKNEEDVGDLPNNIGDDEYKFSKAHADFIYIHASSYGKTKLNNTFFEKRLGCVVTARNWRTINKLNSMMTKNVNPTKRRKLE